MTQNELYLLKEERKKIIKLGVIKGYRRKDILENERIYSMLQAEVLAAKK